LFVYPAKSQPSWLQFMKQYIVLVSLCSCNGFIII